MSDDDEPKNVQSNVFRVFHSLVPNAELETLREIKRAAMEMTDLHDSLIQHIQVHGIGPKWETMYHARDESWERLLDACRRAKEEETVG